MAKVPFARELYRLHCDNLQGKTTLSHPNLPPLRFRRRTHGTFAEVRVKVGAQWKSVALGELPIDEELGRIADETREESGLTGGVVVDAETVMNVVGRIAAQFEAKARQQIANGYVSRAGQRADSLGAIAAQFLRHVEKRRRTQVERKRHLEVDWQALHHRPAGAITKRDIASHLLTIRANRSPIAANRSRATLSAMYKWAMGQGLVDDNPVTGTGKADEPRREPRKLSLEELRAIWQATDGGSDHDTIVRLLMLTGQRREEVGGMLWTELDLDRALWSLPGSRTKNGRPHVVPLSTHAIELLRARERDDRAYVFGNGAGSFSGWSRSKARLDRRCVVINWTLHDLRKAFATHVDEMISAPHVVEMALNHVSGVKAGVAGLYNEAKYLPERTRAMQRWADELLGAEPAKVIPLHATA